jgi:hypothetical protein
MAMSDSLFTDSLFHYAKAVVTFSVALHSATEICLWFAKKQEQRRSNVLISSIN